MSNSHECQALVLPQVRVIGTAIIVRVSFTAYIHSVGERHPIYRRDKLRFRGVVSDGGLQFAHNLTGVWYIVTFLVS